MIAAESEMERDEEFIKWVKTPSLDCPVLVFGGDRSMADKLGAALSPRKVHTVLDEGQLDRVSVLSRNMKNDVLIMSWEYSIGVDMRFDRNA